MGTTISRMMANNCEPDGNRENRIAVEWIEIETVCLCATIRKKRSNWMRFTRAKQHFCAVSCVCNRYCCCCSFSSPKKMFGPLYSSVVVTLALANVATSFRNVRNRVKERERARKRMNECLYRAFMFIVIRPKIIMMLMISSDTESWWWFSRVYVVVRVVIRSVRKMKNQYMEPSAMV